jgi:hypothetical protein
MAYTSLPLIIIIIIIITIIVVSCMVNITGNKDGGKQKGTPNRIIRELRSVLKDLMYDEKESLQERLDAINRKERAFIIQKISAQNPLFFFINNNVGKTRKLYFPEIG